MKIIVAGGTGFVGSRLVESLARGGHAVTMLVRDAAKAARFQSIGVGTCRWTDLDCAPAFEGAGAVINLAGEGVADAPWTPGRKERILQSRVESTRFIVNAMARTRVRPGVLVNASAVGFYGSRTGAGIDESAPAGKGFLSEVCVAWEREALKSRELGVRVVLLRFGAVLGQAGGVLSRMLLPFRFGLGGRLGPGTQGFPWVHIDDAVSLAQEAVTNPMLSGPVNAVAPDAVTNAEFASALGRALHRPAILPVPAFTLRLMLGEMSEMLLTGQCAVPVAAQKAGYRFKFPRLKESLEDILGI